MLCVVDRQHRYHVVNPAFAARYDRLPEEIQGLHVTDLRSPEFYDRVVRPRLERSFAGEPIVYEEWFDYPVHGRRYMEVRYHPLEEEGQIEYVVIFVRDLTDRQRATEEREQLLTRLERRAAELDVIVENAGAQLALLDLDYNFVRVNSAYADRSGHRSEDLIGRNHFAIFPNAENESIFTRVRETGEPFHAVEKAFVYADQPERAETYWTWSLVPMKDEGGLTVGLLLTLADVTAQVVARRQIERLAAEAQQQAARLSALLRSLSSAVTVVEAEGRIVFRNEASKRLTGLAPEETSSLDGLGHLRVYDRNGRLLPVEDFPASRLLRGETVEEFECIVERPDGTRRVTVSSGSALRGADGNVVAGILVTRDVTELRRLEETREEFIFTISHDLRQPLTVIQGQAQMLLRILERAGQSQTTQRSLEAIISSAKRMGAMITDLVESARMESGQLQLSLEPIDLYGVLADLVDRASTDSDRGRLELAVPDHALSVLADRVRLERVVVNIVTNALHYSPPEKPVILAMAERDGRALVSVRDEGPGIAADEQSRLFQRYRRLRPDQRSEGLGLGLYISRLIVEAHGGTIWVESELGAGSTFYFTLPLVA